jgi:hypothetical protein
MTRRDVNVNKGAKNIYNENKTRKRQGMTGMRVSAIHVESIAVAAPCAKERAGKKKKPLCLVFSYSCGE